MISLGLQRLIKLTPHMRPAAKLSDATISAYLVITLIAIGL
jgi:hypothetical protein